MKPQVIVKHSSQILTRRRALFPSKDSIDSDLDSISPLNLDDENCVSITKNEFSLKGSVGDYNIIGLVVKGDSVSTPNNPASDNKDSELFSSTPTNIEESPTQKLKTPNDLTDNSKFPKLNRSKVNDTILNPDCKNPKVRTALFPELDMSVPSRSFYPKSEITLKKDILKVSNVSSLKVKKKQVLYLCNRKSKLRSGQINAGVRHKIKKRKLKRLSKASVIQAAINIIENSPLNEILSDNVPLLASKEVPVLSSPFKDPTPSPEPDPNKKFFKSSRQKGVVSVHSNLKLKMENGRLTVLDKKRQGIKRQHCSDLSHTKRLKPNEFDFTEETVLPCDLSNIINSLDNKEYINKDENSISKQAVINNDDILMSPTSQMCNMASGLALNSPKKARDLSQILENIPDNQQMEKKLFPVFYPGNKSLPLKPTKSPQIRKLKSLSKDQMLLDAGQKRWGVTQCTECKFVYHIGDPGDEMMHLNYHSAAHLFTFNGWKHERVVSNSLLDGKIIQIVPEDPKLWWKRVKDVMEVVNRELGFYEMKFESLNSQIYFYIKNRTIIGVLVAEPKEEGYKLLTTATDQVDLCSEESYPVKCGISRIWVSPTHRKKGVGTSLMNALKGNFMFGYILQNEDIAFSSPTEMGKLFGQKYFKTSNFLICFV